MKLYIIPLFAHGYSTNSQNAIIRQQCKVSCYLIYFLCKEKRILIKREKRYSKNVRSMDVLCFSYFMICTTLSSPRPLRPPSSLPLFVIKWRKKSLIYKTKPNGGIKWFYRRAIKERQDKRRGCLEQAVNLGLDTVSFGMYRVGKIAFSSKIFLVFCHLSLASNSLLSD